MTGKHDQGSAEVIIGAFDRRGGATDSGSDNDEDREAEVIRFAPYLLARSGQAVEPPANRA